MTHTAANSTTTAAKIRLVLSLAAAMAEGTNVWPGVAAARCRAREATTCAAAAVDAASPRRLRNRTSVIENCASMPVATSMQAT